jgi:NAD-dependent deacetylase
LVVGTSLSVFPAAGLLKSARHAAEKVLVDLEPDKKPYGFKVMRGSAETVLPSIVERWLKETESPTMPSSESSVSPDR